jgi:hypothetical protein
MSNYRVVSEDEGAFTVDDGRGPFKVAKRGLSKSTLSRIQSFADGGEVQPDWLAPQQTVMPPPAVSAFDPAQSAPTVPLAIEPGGNVGLAPPPAFAFDPTQRYSPRMALQSTETPFQAGEGVAFGFDPKQRATPPLRIEEPAKPARPAKPAAPAAAVAPAPAAPAAPNPLDVAEQEQIAGIKAQAEVAAREADELARMQADTVTQQEALAKARDENLAAHKQRGETLYNDVLNSKIDPNQWWGSRSTGQKISASIGMLLGGIGQGLIGGGNAALGVIDSAIDKDIDAQKEERGKKQGLLAYHAQQGRDDQTAAALAKADLLDLSAARIQQAAMQFGGEKAKATALSAVGQIRQQSAGIRSNIEQQRMTTQIARAQLAVQQRAQQIAEHEYERKIAAQTALGGGGGGAVNPELLEPEQRERLITLPTGEQRLALTKDGATKVRAVTQGANELQSAVDEMRAFRKRVSGGKLFGSADAKEAESMRTRALGALTRLNEGGMSKEEIALLSSMVPNPGDFMTTDSIIDARLTQIEQQIESRRDSAISAHLGVRAQGGLTLETAAQAGRR